jgi:hypothetical protein
MYIVHVDYGRNCTMVRCPDGSGKMFYCSIDITNFLRNRKWRYAI